MSGGRLADGLRGVNAIFSWKGRQATPPEPFTYLWSSPCLASGVLRCFPIMRPFYHRSRKLKTTLPPCWN